MPDMSVPLFDKITCFAKKLGLFEYKQWIVSFSGGADSRLLLEWALSVRPIQSIKAIYFDHQLRDSRSDLTVLHSLHDTIQIECMALPVAQYASNNQISLEMAGRHLRYEKLLEYAHANHINIVLTGHHMDDQIETIIMRLAMGSFLGTAGIPEIRKLDEHVSVARPLIRCEKQEIIDELLKRQLIWSEDPTNNSNQFQRNIVRNEIIPALKKLNSNLNVALNRFSTTMKSATDMIDQTLLTCTQNHLGLNIELLNTLHPFLARSVIRRYCDNNEPNPRLITQEHIEGLLQVSKDKIQNIQLPGNRFGIKKSKTLLIAAHLSLKAIPPTEVIPNQIPTTINWPLDRSVIHLSWVKKIDKDELKQKNTIQFLGVKLTNQTSVIIRNRQKGDRFQALGQQSVHLLSRFMSKRKIPREVRNNIPLLIIDNQIVSVLGYEVSEQAAVRTYSKEILRVEYQK